MWIEVFKTGTFQTKSGSPKIFTTEDLDRIANSYNPSRHEAPVTIGYPKDTDPAYGWVESLKRSGGSLMAKIKEFVPEFAEMVRKGLFKKRIISLYPDLKLKFVGFLGADPPALDLPVGINFKEGDNTMTFDYSLEDDPGEELAKKTLEILNNPPKYGPQGKRLSQELTYGEAFNIACQENPKLAQAYVEQIRIVSDNNSPFHKIL